MWPAEDLSSQPLISRQMSGVAVRKKSEHQEDEDEARKSVSVYVLKPIFRNKYRGHQQNK